MIAFGTPLTDPEAYRRYARAGLERCAEPGSELLAFAAVGSIGRGYNLVLDAAARLPDLEALVLVQQHVELTTPDVCARVREALADPDVAAVGAIGASGLRSIAWWEGEVRGTEPRLRYQEHGAGEIAAYGWTAPRSGPADVETVDGALLALSPWAVRELRFDEALRTGHGYDVDFCLQVRDAGRRVRVADLPAVHHAPLELVEDYDLWVEGHVRVAEKWTGRALPDAGDEDAWRRRARRAEAEREAARTTAYSRTSDLEARERQLTREIDALKHTGSWRLTAPLRRMNKLRADAAARRAAGSD